MTFMEQIQQRLSQLPPDKQGEVLDFVAFLQDRLGAEKKNTRRILRKHPAFGSWRGRKIDSIAYQQAIRSEWDRQ